MGENMTKVERDRLTGELENHRSMLVTMVVEKPKDRLDGEAKERAIALAKHNINVLEGLLS